MQQLQQRQAPLGAVAMGDPLVPGPIDLYELALRARFYGALDFVHQLAELLISASLRATAMPGVVVRIDDIVIGHYKGAHRQRAEQRRRNENAIARYAPARQRRLIAAAGKR